MILLDESHCSAHSYADLGLVALDIFTCGDTDPKTVLAYMQEELDLGDLSVIEVRRFVTAAQASNDRLRVADLAANSKG